MSSTATDPPRPAFVSPYNHVSVRSRSFLQALADTTPSPKQENAAAIYVHPLVKKSSAKLSEKSLEMCTESLGSETGSDVIMEEALTVNSSSPVHRKESKVVGKTKREYNFPPLLTSISNSAGVEFHRENGRLVMNAVVFMESSGSSLFHAERINGRLTLHLKNLSHEETEEPEFEAHGETRETDGGGEGDAEDSIEDVENLEGNMGIEENISRVGRCNEESGGERREGHLWNMETCWVAI